MKRGQMTKPGEKQKRRPRVKDKKQSERFKEAARQVGADQESDTLGRIVTEMARRKRGNDDGEGSAQ